MKLKWWQYVVAAVLFIPMLIMVWFMQTRTGEQMLAAMFCGRWKDK